MRTAGLLLAISCAVATSGVFIGAGEVHAAACKGPRRVLIRAKTPLRRGPGLNYAVAKFFEKNTCAPYSEVSLDEQWVLVEIGRSLGWVPVKRLSKASRKRLAKRGTAGPIGSGQARSMARVFRQSVLLERPEPRAPVRRVLPENLRVLPLAVTREGRWTQVRDERGDIGWVASEDLVGEGLDALPRTETEGVDPRAPAQMGTARSSKDSKDSKEAPAKVERASRLNRSGVGLRVALYGSALNPIHSLDSNGVAGIRRYDLSAAAPGTGLEVEVQNLGPLAIRLGYSIAFLNDVTSDDVPGTGSAGGLQHDAYWRLGWPLTVAGVQLTPEVGYHLGMFDFDSILAGQQQVVFLSTQSHTGTVGLRAQALLLDGLVLDVDAGGMLGVTQESPRSLGDAGLTVGFVGQVGVRYYLNDELSIMGRYVANYRSTGYTGQAQLDPTITDATLVDVTHGLLAGVAFDL